MTPPRPNEEAIRATWRWLAHTRHGVAEVRAIRPGRGGVVGLGFFDDEEAFASECVRANASANVYVGIQPRPRRLLEAAPNVLRPLKAGATREDIEVLSATVIDLDPVRPKHSASTQDELSMALEVASQVAEWCVEEGLAPPRLMMSGNGAQLWFALPPTPLGETLAFGLKAFEAEVRKRFQSLRVHVDSIHDGARIIKVIGTVSHKGTGDAIRPHRVSEWRSPVERLEDPRLLERLRVSRASLPPAPAASKARRTSTGEYDWATPVEMCAGVRRLWEEGATDRSLAIFNMVRFFAHRGLGLEEVTPLILEYDRRGLGKLQGRDGAAYVRMAWEKVQASAGRDGLVAPPCRSLRRMGYCAEPASACDAAGRAKASTRRKANEAQGDDPMEGEVFEGARCYFTLTPKRERVISSFTIEPTHRISTESGELLLGQAHTDKGGTVALRLPLTAFHSKRDFVKHLPSADLQWTGSDNNVQGVLRLLSRRPVPRVAGAGLLGFYRHEGQDLWLGPGCILGAKGFVEPRPVEYVPSGASLAKRISYAASDDEAFRAVARVVFKFLPYVNTPAAILPVLGWYFATPMKPRLMKAVGSFPSLFVWGTQGSGKSSLCIDVMWPLFGVRDAEPYSATETEFALLKLLSSTTSVPVFIDEYKPYDMPKHRLSTLHRYLRRLYRGEVEERGRPDLTVSSYHLQAPVCVAGETRPTEAALLERILTSNPDKTTLREKSGFQHAHQELRAVDLALFAPRYIQFCLGRDFAADLEVARAVTQSVLGERKPPIRVVENLTAMVLGVHLFEEFAAECGCEVPPDLGIGAAVDAVLADVMETDHGVKNALDHFLEMLGVMAVQGYLQEGMHYAFAGGLLALHLESAYDAFRIHCKRIDYPGELVDLKALRRLIYESRKQAGVVVSESERVVFDSMHSRRRAVLFDLAKAACVVVDDFPTSVGGAALRPQRPPVE